MKRILRPCWLFCALLAGASSALAQTKPTGTPVPEDSPVFSSFKLLELQPAYRMTINMESTDPRMAQMAAHGGGMSPSESIVKGAVHQASTHMKIPALDVKGLVDDWEIRAVVKDGRGARIINSAAIPRLQKFNEQMLAMQLAMMDKMAVNTVARAAAQGPYGAITAALTVAETVAFNAMAVRELKKANEFYGWKCLDKIGGNENPGHQNPLTDLRPLPDDTVNGTPVSTYEFYVRDGDNLHGPAHFFVNKSTGLPLRIDLTDPHLQGSIRMDYSYDNIGDIEIPPCLAK
jgi:hypothetical protein